MKAIAKLVRGIFIEDDYSKADIKYFESVEKCKAAGYMLPKTVKVEIDTDNFNIVKEV